MSNKIFGISVNFIFVYTVYLLILLTLIYYSFFIIYYFIMGYLFTIILIITGILYPIIFNRSLKLEKEIIEEE